MTLPNLASTDVHAWCVRLDASPVATAGLYAVLSDEERNRSARLRFDRDRRRCIVAHGVLRKLLGQYAGAGPGDLRFVHNGFGKPELAAPFGRRLRFSLSHSADLALVAVALYAEVGADIERVRADVDGAEIARRFFSADEIDYLNRVPRSLQAEVFFGIWTRKEACLKARGEGFAASPTDFSVLQLHGTWSLLPLQPAPGYVGAVAVQGMDRKLTLHDWVEDGLPATASPGTRASSPLRATAAP